MPLTLGLTGIDQATEVAIKVALADTSHRLGGVWRLVGDNDAEYVIVDMDTMYGPMTWLRLHAAGKRVVALTAAPRTQADYLLEKPFVAQRLVHLLHQIAGTTNAPEAANEAQLAPQTAPTTTAPTPIDLEAALAELATLPAQPSPPDVAATVAATATTAAPAPARQTESVDAVLARLNGSASIAPPPAVATVQFVQEPVAEAEPATPATPNPPASDEPAPEQTVAEPVADIGIGPVLRRLDPAGAAAEADDVVHIDIAPEAQDAAPEDAMAVFDAGIPAEEVPPPAVSRSASGFADWLRLGALNGRARFQRDDGPELLIDFSRRHYYGPSSLKKVAEYFVVPVGLRDFEQLDDHAWEGETAVMGKPQPLQRLQWLGGLLAGGGRLLPGYPADSRYALEKWPETEREYPRHFRIATAMMKGPAKIEEIATASSVALGEVADFINANLATGYARRVDDTPPAEPEKSGGLFGRLRGR